MHTINKTPKNTIKIRLNIIPLSKPQNKAGKDKKPNINIITYEVKLLLLIYGKKISNNKTGISL